MTNKFIEEKRRGLVSLRHKVIDREIYLNGLEVADYLAETIHQAQEQTKQDIIKEIEEFRQSE